MTVASVMVAGGKADVKLLNDYLKDYSDLLFGKKSSSKTKKVGKEEIFENLKGFRTMFKDQVTFKPKVGKKFDTEVNNMDIKDLMKLEKN